MKHGIFSSNKCYGITQDLITKDFMIIMDNYIMGGIMEFVPYDQFKDIEYIAKFESYKATWIEGNIQSWNKKEINFKRSGPIQVVFKRLNNFKNITSKDINEVGIH